MGFTLNLLSSWELGFAMFWAEGAYVISVQ